MSSPIYLNTSEGTSGGKVWTSRPLLRAALVPGVPHPDDISQDAGVSVPANWTSSWAACDTLSAKGITPIAGGVKDGWFGGWLYSIMGSQSLTSIEDLKQAVVGDKKFTSTVSC